MRSMPLSTVTRSATNQFDDMLAPADAECDEKSRNSRRLSINLK